MMEMSETMHESPSASTISPHPPPRLSVQRFYGVVNHEPTHTGIRDLPVLRRGGFASWLTSHFQPGSAIHPHFCSHAHSHSHSYGNYSAEGSRHREILLRDVGADIRTSDGASAVDVEKGPSDYQRFVLNINGLKCGCCETGITKAVGRIPAVRDHLVNVVMARLEFDLDVNRITIDDVLTKLNAATGYTFEQNSRPKDQVLEFLHTSTHKFHRDARPKGITAIELPDPHKQFWNASWHWTRSNLALNELRRSCSEKLSPKSVIDKCITASRQPQLVRIHYNAKVIGAREIYDFYRRRDGQLLLAPPPAHSSLKLGAKQTRRALCLFLPASMLTVPVLVFAWAPIDHDKIVYAHASIALASVVQIIAWVEFLPSALRSLWYSRVLDMDFLISFSTATAYAFSVVCYAYQIFGKPLETQSFFETSTLLVSLILLGR